MDEHFLNGIDSECTILSCTEYPSAAKTPNLISFCSVIKINKKKYKLCSNKKKNKFHTKANNSTVVLTNLSELINYNNEKPKPIVSFISVDSKF